MNLAKLTAFTWDKPMPAKAEKYIHQIIDKKMLVRLKKYLEVELFLCIHLKVGKGISLSTACQWLHWEGFWYMKYKKMLYYDGHDWPDILDYHQNQYLPAIQQYQSCLVEYKIGEVETKVIKQLKPGKRRLVLVVHDKSTMQANDGEEKGLGTGWWTAIVEERSGEGTSPEWCYLLNLWVVERCKCHNGIWQKLWWLLDRWIVCETGMQIWNQDHSPKGPTASWENHSWI